jgi:putative membrane protein
MISVDWVPFMKTLVASIVYSLIGILMFLLGFLVIRAVTPFSLRKEIEEDHNTSVAIIAAAMLIGISIIIAAAILG